MSRAGTGTALRDRIRRAVNLVNAAADGAGDEDVTPSGIAEAIRDSLEEHAPRSEHDKVGRYLLEALDAVSDGMPNDYVAMILYAALGALEEA
jgi:hypothetical protein